MELTCTVYLSDTDPLERNWDSPAAGVIILREYPYDELDELLSFALKNGIHALIKQSAR